MKRRIYLDHAAGTGNPSSIHKEGVKAKKHLDEARASLGASLSAHADEIVLLGSGTESDNLAVLGVFKHARLDPAFSGRSVHVITTMIEHPAVLQACRHIEAMGAEVTYLSVNEEGLIDLKELRAALRPDTILVSIAYANNEIGTIQPLRETRKEIAHFKKEHALAPNARAAYPLFHTDACQAAPYMNMNVEQLGVDLLTLNGTKLGAPQGTALLYVRRGTPIVPMLYGGGQEKGLRSGTENISGASALARSLKAAQGKKEKESARLIDLRDFFFAKLKKEFPKARLNGSLTERLPNNMHISFPNIQSELLVLELDAKGIAASAGSACASAKDAGSHVLEALYGKGDEKKWGSVRFSFGPETTKRDLERTLTALKEIFKKYSSLR